MLQKEQPISKEQAHMTDELSRRKRGPADPCNDRLGLILSAPSRRQPRYNAATEKSMEEARAIMAGRAKADGYDSAEAMFAALDE